MSRTLRNILFVIAGMIGIAILISVAFLYFVDAGVYKAPVERAASDALGMEVSVGGRLGIGLFPGPHIKLVDVRVRNRGMDIVSAKNVRLQVALLPLLRGEVRIKTIGLRRPKISIRRHRNGAFNFETGTEPKPIRPRLVPDTLSLSDGALLYEDEQSREGFEVDSFTLRVQDFRITGRTGAGQLTHLSFTAGFTCREIRTKDLLLSDVRLTCTGKDGNFVLDPVTMRLFRGQGAASIGADFSGPAPRVSVRASLTKFRIEEYLKILFPKKVAEGAMDFSVRLAMRGNTVAELTQTAAGEATLRGENLTLYGKDLDREFTRFESSQNFNLVDAGAFFFAGPVGLAVTKGYAFASIFQGSQGSTSIERLFSDWNVERGIAQAKDVALATKANRIALKGKVNFVDRRFDDLTIALIDARGCARVQQKIHGPFVKPVVEKPSVLASLAGPALNLLKQARDLVTGGTCPVFYNGSVPMPK